MSFQHCFNTFESKMMIKDQKRLGSCLMETNIQTQTYPVVEVLEDNTPQPADLVEGNNPVGVGVGHPG